MSIQEILDFLGQKYKQPADSQVQEAQSRRQRQRAKESETLSGRMRLERIKQQRQSLPIFAQKSVFLSTLAENQIVIVVGETGSGKTTQIPQYLAEANYGIAGIIGCTQPRRVAACSVAHRVSVEYGCEVGSEVGYTIRFEDITSGRTIIKYMTDGILLQECIRNPNLDGYSVIMLDEAHERTINTDVLFGLLKETIKKRTDLRLIISSATMDYRKFSAFFHDAPTLNIPGRLFDVEVIYTNSNTQSYLKAAEEKVIEIHKREKPGDILVFLTGQEDIETLCERLYERVLECGSLVSRLNIHPLYGALEGQDQMRVFEDTPSGARKVVVATNIAESSLTIDGVVYVIDAGLVKQKIHQPKSGMDSLEIIWISQAQAMQRTGRAGRTAPGKCYRLYSTLDFNKMPLLFVPEIQRSNLASVVLKLKAMGIKDVVHFSFMDAPPAEAMIGAVYHLLLLGAVTAEEAITDIGTKMSAFPLDPCLAKYLILSAEMGCSDEVLTIVSLFSVQNIQKLFRRPKAKRGLADSKHANFHKPEGDHLTLLAIYSGWKENRHSEDWCKTNFLSIDVLRKAQEIRGQLLHLMDRQGLPIISCEGKADRVQRTICATFYYNAASRADIRYYKVLRDGELVNIRPGCSVWADRPPCVVFNEVLRTKKSYMLQVTKVEPNWLQDYAPMFFTQSHYSSSVVAKNQFNDLKLSTEFRMKKFF